MEILGIKKLTDYKWINLFDVEYKNKTGNVSHWTFASRKANPVVGKLPIQADAVVIIPIHKNKKQRNLVVIKEFRIPLGDYEYGLPAGLYDHNESAEDVARRELKEETGLDLTKVLYVSTACVSSAGLSDESVVYVVCECTGEINNDGNEGSEEIEVALLNIKQIKELRECNSGTAKISAKALPFFLMFEGLKKIKWPKSLTQKPTRLTKKQKRAAEVELSLKQMGAMLLEIGTAPIVQPGEGSLPKDLSKLVVPKVPKIRARKHQVSQSAIETDLPKPGQADNTVIKRQADNTVIVKETNNEERPETLQE